MITPEFQQLNTIRKKYKTRILIATLPIERKSKAEFDIKPMQKREEKERRRNNKGRYVEEAGRKLKP